LDKMHFSAEWGWERDGRAFYVSGERRAESRERRFGEQKATKKGKY